ncbi:TetR/AcrR family transcriptional regulator [Oleisolibacter albus]|uniref:TetR/AcrR family transcriptional regulator n=1 Tax=Oleisolibacter albus TaxID=2171757 RepID=UPI000DF26F15|nr:TetR/AcrR family transcriptional regulator [Oleisolibacter albus]
MIDASDASLPPAAEPVVSVEAIQPDKTPRTERGKRTLRRLLDAAAAEFGERGYHEASISGITQRAGAALGTFYTYFDSKEQVFRALVDHMGRLTRQWIADRVAAAPDRITAERLGLEAFITFARSHKDLYRIVMEAQFVAEDAYRAYYRVFAEAYRRNLALAGSRGEIRPGADEERAWALIGMSVFLGLRYGIWDDSRPAAEVAAAVADLIAHGLTPAMGAAQTGPATGPKP